MPDQIYILLFTVYSQIDQVSFHYFTQLWQIIFDIYDILI